MKNYKLILKDGREITVKAVKYQINTKESVGRVIHFYGETSDKAQPETFVRLDDVTAVIAEDCQ